MLQHLEKSIPGLTAERTGAPVVDVCGLGEQDTSELRPRCAVAFPPPMWPTSVPERNSFTASRRHDSRRLQRRLSGLLKDPGGTTAR